VRFLLELCALAALGWWGAETGSGVLGRAALAAGAVSVAATAWGLVVAPKATLDAGPVVRWAVELAVFAAATAALVAIGHPRLGVALAVVYVVDRAVLVARP
jgi:hypothetical protein